MLEKGEGRVGFTIRTSLLELQAIRSIDICQRLYHKNEGSTLTHSVLLYALTLDAPLETSMSFYKTLQNAIASLSKDDKLMEAYDSWRF